MKKIFIVLTCILLTASNIFASECCQKQENDEVVIKGIINSPSGRLSKHYVSFKEDYNLYKSGDKTSIYSSLLKLEEKYNKKNDKNAEINLRYIQKTKELYEFLINYPSESTMSTIFVNEFDEKKILIPDSVYDTLDEDLITIITLINVYK